MPSKVWLLSTIVGDGTPIINPFRPQFSGDYPHIGCDDDTGRECPPLGTPPQIVVVTKCDDVQLTTIETDNRYFVVATEG